MADDEEFLEEDASENKENFEEEMDNDEISPEEEGFMQGYEKAEEEKEEKPQQEKPSEEVEK